MPSDAPTSNQSKCRSGDASSRDGSPRPRRACARAMRFGLMVDISCSASVPVAGLTTTGAGTAIGLLRKSMTRRTIGAATLAPKPPCSTIATTTYCGSRRIVGRDW